MTKTTTKTTTQHVRTARANEHASLSPEELAAEAVAIARARIAGYWLPSRRLPKTIADSDDWLQRAAEVALERLDGWQPDLGRSLSNYIRHSVDWMVRESIHRWARTISMPRYRHRSDESDIVQKREAVKAATSLSSCPGLAPRCDDVHVLAVDRKIDRCIVRKRIRAALTEREWDVLRWHYLRGETFKEIAERLGVCKSRVQQIEAKAIRKARAAVGDMPFDVV